MLSSLLIANHAVFTFCLVSFDPLLGDGALAVTAGRVDQDQLWSWPRAEPVQDSLPRQVCASPVGVSVEPADECRDEHRTQNRHAKPDDGEVGADNRGRGWNLFLRTADRVSLVSARKSSTSSSQKAAWPKDIAVITSIAAPRRGCFCLLYGSLPGPTQRDASLFPAGELPEPSVRAMVLRGAAPVDLIPT